MMISFYRITIFLTLVTVLSGCSLFGNNEPEYIASYEAEHLKVPQGLDDPKGATPVIIPAPDMRAPTGDELESMPPRVARTVASQDADVQMAWSAEGVYLLVKDSPASVAQKLRAAIEQVGMTLLKGDESGAHKFHYTQSMPADEGFFSNMAFWRSGPADYSGTFMTSLKVDAKGTRVYLLFGNGESCDSAGSEHVLGVLMERLG